MALEAATLSCLKTFVRQYCGAIEVDAPVLEYVAGAAKDYKPGDVEIGWVDTVQQFLQPTISGDELKLAALKLLTDIHNPPQQDDQASKTSAATMTRLRADAPSFVPRFLIPAQEHQTAAAMEASTPAVAHTSSLLALPDRSCSADVGNGTSVFDTTSDVADDWSTAGPLAGMACTDHQAVALLSSWFPSYAKDSLLQIYLASGRNLSAAVQDVTGIEQEAVVMNIDLHPVTSPQPTPKIVLESSAFPELSASMGKHAASAAAPTGKSFAGAVKSSIASKGGPPAAAAPPPPKPAKQPVALAVKQQHMDAPWVSTGEAVAREYAGARADARDLARLRNVCFQQATLAYLSGQKALAKELSDKGRRFAEQMQAAHAEASASIFRQRNAVLAKHPSSTPGRRFLDLHGLHVAEARSALQVAVTEHCRNPGAGMLYVIVGTGHHTKGSKAAIRLPAAVQAQLHDLGLAFREIRPGMLQVDV